MLQNSVRSAGRTIADRPNSASELWWALQWGYGWPHLSSGICERPVCMLLLDTHPGVQTPRGRCETCRSGDSTNEQSVGMPCSIQTGWPESALAMLRFRRPGRGQHTRFPRRIGRAPPSIPIAAAATAAAWEVIGVGPGDWETQ